MGRLLVTVLVVAATAGLARCQEGTVNPVLHCHMIQSGEVQAVVGDCSRDGMGGPQYCGLWSLTSKQRQFNCFGNSYAGLIPGDLRGKSVTVEIVDEQTVALVHKADETFASDGRATYRIVGPNCIEHTLTIRDARSFLSPQGYREVSWCSYINCPEDPTLHFLSGGEWTSYLSPEHGVGSRIAPSYLGERETLPPQDERRSPFHVDWAPLTFDEPFYYGRLGQMLLLYVFDNPTDLRFFCSPTGGGNSLLPGKSCPAWDFLWIIPADRYAPERDYTFRLRLTYKPYVSDDDVLEEARRAQAAMAGTQVQGEK